MTILTRGELYEDWLGPRIDGTAKTVDCAHSWRYDGDASPVALAAEEGAPGTMQLQSGAVSGNATYLFAANSNSSDTIHPDDVDRFSFRVRLNSLSAVAVTLGLGSVVSGVDFGATGAYFVFNSSVDSTIHSRTRDGSTHEDIDLGVALSTSAWRTIEFTRAEGGALWTSAIRDEDGAGLAKAFHTGHLPSAGMAFAVRIETSASANKLLDIDFARLRPRAIPRG